MLHELMKDFYLKRPVSLETLLPLQREGERERRSPERETITEPNFKAVFSQDFEIYSLYAGRLLAEDLQLGVKDHEQHSIHVQINVSSLLL